MISHKYKFIFIHIPKTAGNSLSILLKDISDDKVINYTNFCSVPKNDIDIKCKITNKSIKHENIQYYRKIYDCKIDSYFKFTVIRNPYDRSLSYYYYFYNDKKDEKFNKQQFIMFLNTKGKLQAQYTFIDDSFHIVKYENLIDELKNMKYFSSIIDFDNLTKSNVSYNSKLNYNDILDEECKNIIYTLYKKDFDIFGYKR
jgi:hypothetical protein